MLAPQMQTTPRLTLTSALTSALTLHSVYLMQQLLGVKHVCSLPKDTAPHLPLLPRIACLSGALHGCQMQLLQPLPHDY